MLMENGRDLAKAQEIIVFFERYAEICIIVFSTDFPTGAIAMIQGKKSHYFLLEIHGQFLFVNLILSIPGG